jgi:hypothetical protein
VSARNFTEQLVGSSQTTWCRTTSEIIQPPAKPQKSNNRRQLQSIYIDYNCQNRNKHKNLVKMGSVRVGEKSVENRGKRRNRENVVRWVRVDGL